VYRDAKELEAETFRTRVNDIHPNEVGYSSRCILMVYKEMS
jgi:hypothetical protein